MFPTQSAGSHRANEQLAKDGGEPLPAGVWLQAEQAASRADVILVVGTSAVVYPAAALATSYGRGAYVVEVNPEETPISGGVDAVVCDPLYPEVAREYGRVTEHE